MKSATKHSPEVRQQATQQFTPLDQETRPTVTTAAAAHYLHYAVQSMRIFACKSSGPIRPIRIGNRLHWSTEEIRRLLADGAK